MNFSRDSQGDKIGVIQEAMVSMCVWMDFFPRLDEWIGIIPTIEFPLQSIGFVLDAL